MVSTGAQAKYPYIYELFEKRLARGEANDLLIFLDNVENDTDCQEIFSDLLKLKIEDMKRQGQSLDENDFLKSYGQKFAFAIKNHFAEGKKFGKELTGSRYISSGGMGDIYLARNVLLPAIVRAVKLTRQSQLQQSYASASQTIPIEYQRYFEEIESRFIREAEISLFLENHNDPRKNNIVKAYSVGRTEDNELYLVLEYIKGANLIEFINGYRKKSGKDLPIKALCAIFYDVADTLDFLHRYIIHRDIKPQNIMISYRDKKVKILDYGLAKIRSDSDEFDPGGITTRSSGGHYVGTPSYSSPEQILDASTVDHRADLYSMGCAMFELLAHPHSPPYPVTSPLGLHEQRIKLIEQRNANPSPDLRNPDCPKKLKDIIDRLLNPNPNKRIQTAAELAELLKPLASPKLLEACLTYFCDNGPEPIDRKDDITESGGWKIWHLLKRNSSSE